MAEGFTMAGGTQLVFAWLEEVVAPKPGMLFWSALDQPLRLALTQAWMMNCGHDVASDRNVSAQQLSEVVSTHPLFAQMLADTITQMRSVYADLDGRPALVGVTDLVALDMELVVLTSNEFAGDYPGGASIPAHCFITRLVEGEWRIAATARRIPIPGWPPTEAIVPGLSVD